MSDAVEISQGKQRMHLRQILRDPAVACLGMAPQPLDHEVGVLDDCAHSGITPVAHALAFSQWIPRLPRLQT